ncbi:cell division protein FtsQ/DivIB [Sporosarcina limicola]|uniref:Cell division protein DivIB n=1 Tax=Sporosarcina limicola TaxID=34101 RepID=A0A927MFK9_9BACL|nr:cell division protein FtsQ/DivIB [Sporosarcina limicola]MBE1553555.1 cell division protein FtsQ [Sporosarcina limicola]
MEKVIDIEERIPSMREKRRRKTNKKFRFILTVFIVALLAVLYLQSPLSKVDSISVMGAVLQDPDFYKVQSGLTVGSPFWSFSSGEIKDALEKIDGVQGVTVSRKWLRDIEIIISEWKTVAYIEEDGQYSLLLENGETLPAGMLLPEAEAPVLNNIKDLGIQKRLIAQLLKMDENIYQIISEIIYEGTEVDPDRLTVYMDDGNEVRAVISTFAESMVYYPDMIAQLNGYEKGIIDIEIGAYFTPFSKEYGEEKEGDSVDEKDE